MGEHMTTHTELGNEVRAEVARILKRFGDCDLAGVKVETIRKIDAFLNPEPDTYRIPVERDTPAYTALRIAGINRIIEADEEANAFLFGGK